MRQKNKKIGGASKIVRQDNTSATHASFSLQPDNHLVHIAIIIFLILIVYSNSLNVPFGWDEDTWIITNPMVKDIHYFFNPSAAKGVYSDYLYSTYMYLRYIGFLTFALNYKFNGWSPPGYHIVNIAIHIANSILVYFLGLLTFRTPFMTDGSRAPVASRQHETAPLIAFFSSLIFATHPLLTDAVTGVYQRFTSLAALFYLLSLVTYIRSRLSEGKLRRLFYYSICLLSAILAMKTKENAFTLPIIIALYEFCFFSGGVKKRVLILAPIVLTLSIIPLTFMSLPGALQLHVTSKGIEIYRWEYLFTQFRVIVTYLRMLFFPVQLNLDYEYPIFHSFFNPQVMLSFIFLTTLLGLGLYLVVKPKAGALEATKNSIKNNSPILRFPDSPSLRLLGFGIVWFFITLSVESSIIPLTEVIDEYRAYLPSVGPIISIITGLFLLGKKMRSPKGREGILVMLVIIIGVLSVATYLRNEASGDKIRVWEVIAKRYPARAQVHNNFGNVYEDNNMFDKAMEQYLIAIKLKPDYAEAHFNLGHNYQSRSMFDKAIEQYLIAITLKPDYVKAHNNLGTTYSALKMPDKAIEQYLIVIKLVPDHAEAHFNLGLVYCAINRPDKAKNEFETVMRLKPDIIENARRNIAAGLKITPGIQQVQQLLETVSH